MRAKILVGAGWLPRVRGSPERASATGQSATRRRHLFCCGAGLVGLEGPDPLKAILGAEAAVEIILQGLEEGVGREKLLHSQAVSQVGERQRDFEVGGN